MNSEQAKKIDFPNLLSNLGFEPIKSLKQGFELWYNSPLRNEKTASFHTSFLKGQWIWKDFGDVGGTVIDFVMRYKNTDVAGALAFLEDRVGERRQVHAPFIVAEKPIRQLEKEEIFTLLETKDFGSNSALSKYIISERCIDKEIAQQFLTEIYFVNNQNGKCYFAAGFKNREGGYEIRNPFFKGTVPETTKSLSLIKMGEENKEIMCFEGFMDFLSFGTLFGLQNHQNYLILNTVSYAKQAVQIIKDGNYQKVKTFFDNDKAGEETTQYFKKELLNVQPQNAVYALEKDLNAYLTRFKQSIIE